MRLPARLLPVASSAEQREAECASLPVFVHSLSVVKTPSPPPCLLGAARSNRVPRGSRRRQANAQATDLHRGDPRPGQIMYRLPKSLLVRLCSKL
ncbi:hypothetical protein SKAU_G00363590 [Synaphobranchus kaupii]|uniref:Uncharacterized protein n=1 Tax=Synaphobranchus kaupii TaxID=118154 RepID=A0A9Q1EIX2_SYNKA|nr:hypothetical protein SKAU_G00363590 [Synaphobranchus kaupii]